jgi:hypothetical protein
LLEAKLINSLYIYQDEKSNGKELLEIKNSLLPFCAEYYKAMIMLKKIETFYDDKKNSSK